MRSIAEPTYLRLARGFRGHVANLQPRHRKESLQLAATRLSTLQHQQRLTSDQRTSRMALEVALERSSLIARYYLLD